MQGVRQKSALLQNIEFESKMIRSSVSSTECYVCGKGLQDGCSVTAKTLPNGIVLFCDFHYGLT